MTRLALGANDSLAGASSTDARKRIAALVAATTGAAGKTLVSYALMRCRIADLRRRAFCTAVLGTDAVVASFVGATGYGRTAWFAIVARQVGGGATHLIGCARSLCAGVIDAFRRVTQ